MTARPPTIVVLAGSQWNQTRRFLDSLHRTDIAGSSVLVVGANPGEPLSRELELAFPSLRLIASSEGGPVAANLGIASAGTADDIVLVSDNLDFPRPDWLRRILGCSEQMPAAGILGCRLVTRTGLLIEAGRYLERGSVRALGHGWMEKDVGQFIDNREVEAVSFACVYLRRRAIDQVGSLDEALDADFAAHDYCLRARRLGLPTVVCGDVSVQYLAEPAAGTEFDQELRRYQKSRYQFRETWWSEIEQGDRVALLWQSTISGSTGYAVSSRELVRAIALSGIRVGYRYLYGRGTPIPFEEPESGTDTFLSAIRRRLQPPPPFVSVAYGQANVFYRCRGPRRIGFTMIETDGFPADWVREANQMDEVWVPTEFNREGFQRSGLERPIFVIPLGIDPDHFHPGIAGHPNPDGDFVFLANFEWSARKAPELLLKAFNDEFRAGEAARLVCKTLNRDRHISVSGDISRLGLSDTGGRISVLMNRDYPPSEMASFYRSGNCFIAASRGEGWNLPLMEAMACGLPAIATDWGAHREFVHEGNAFPLGVRDVVSASDRPPYAGFHWAEPDVEHLRHLMRFVFENREEAGRRGAAASREIRQNWTWAQSAVKIVERLNARL